MLSLKRKATMPNSALENAPINTNTQTIPKYSKLDPKNTGKIIWKKLKHINKNTN